MAGGRGSRMGLPTEKPMLPFLGKQIGRASCRERVFRAV
jgi:GTP:adenosylcobinamide-phosphate guanylyltransferase